MKVSSLLFLSILNLIPLFISYKENLHHGKDIIISILRAIIQLITVGYILELIFGLENLIVVIALIMIIIMNAAYNTKKRGENIRNVFRISYISIFIGAGITLSALVFSKAIELTTSEIIPVSGMVITNCMIALGLSYRNLNNAFKNRRSEIEVKLSLGADINEASNEILRECLKMSIIPSLDSAKALGIVSLPGMMTGLILAGSSPIAAVKYQMMVIFMTISAVSIASITATYLSYKSFFNERKQLREG